MNDLAVSGAHPVALSLALILEEGFPLADLDRLLASAAAAAAEAGVSVVTGDTKVVERGAGGGCYAVTAGIGVVPTERNLSPKRIRAGDVLLLSGPIAEHGVAVLAAREGLDLGSEIRSDAPRLSNPFAAEGSLSAITRGSAGRLLRGGAGLGDILSDRRRGHPLRPGAGGASILGSILRRE